jgi:predicted nucleic acid-binding protein
MTAADLTDDPARPATALLDINVLVALAWPNHVHHETALHWFEVNHTYGWATSPLTQSGFVRVSPISASTVTPNPRAKPSAC